MTERLTIDFTPAEGAVVRMIGLVERRGYLVRGLAMNEEADSASLTMDVEPRDASRRVQVVAAQLGRLVDVKQVSHSATGTGA